MGQPLDTNSDNIESVTRQCYARAIPPATWSTLIHQQHARTSSDSLGQAVAEALVTLLSEQSPRVISPTVTAYLIHSLDVGIVPIAQLASQLLRHASLASPLLEVGLGICLLSNAQSRRHAPLHSATTLTDLLPALTTAARAVTAAESPSRVPSTIQYLVGVLQKPPVPLTPAAAESDSLAADKCAAAFSQTLTGLSESSVPTTADLRNQLQSAIAALSHEPHVGPTSAAVPNAISSSFPGSKSPTKRKVASDVLISTGQTPRRLTRTRTATGIDSSAAHSPPPFNLDHVAPPLTADPDACAIVSELIHSHPLSFPQSQHGAQARVTAFLATRQLQAALHRGSTPSQALRCALAELIMATEDECELVASDSVTDEDGRGRRKHKRQKGRRVERWAFKSLPSLLETALASSSHDESERRAAMSDAVEMVAGRRKDLSEMSQSNQSKDKAKESESAMDVDQQASNSLSPAPSPFLAQLLPVLAARNLVPPSLLDTYGVRPHPPSASAAMSSRATAESLAATLSESQPDLESVKQALAELARIEAEIDYASGEHEGEEAVRSVVTALVEAVNAAALSLDLQTLRTLLVDSEIANPVPGSGSAPLDIVWLYSGVSDTLSPVRHFLDVFDTSLESFNEAHPIEGYGKIVLWLQVVLKRYRLESSVSLGARKGFCVQWLSASNAAYTLQALDEESRASVKGWIEGLFGDGISDELMHSTNPRILLHVAPTICKQSLAACHSGVIDLPTLKDSFSYFLQDLLSFTLPGVLGWLIGEIGRVANTPTRATLLDILSFFVLSDSLPRQVLELVSEDLAALLARLTVASTTSTSDLGSSKKSIPGSSLDVDKLEQTIRPFVPKLKPAASTTTEIVGAADGIAELVVAPEPSTWLSGFLAALPLALTAPTHATLTSSPSSTLALFPAYHHIRASIPPATLLTTLTSLYVSPLSANTPAAYARAARLARIGNALLACPSFNSDSGFRAGAGAGLNEKTGQVMTWPELWDITTEWLPRRLAVLALARARARTLAGASTGEGERAGTLQAAAMEEGQALAFVLGSALVAARELAIRLDSAAAAEAEHVNSRIARGDDQHRVHNTTRTKKIDEVDVLLVNVARAITGAVAAAEVKQSERSSDAGFPEGIAAFVEGVLAHESLVAASDDLAQLGNES